jgi:hypothetical protein
MFFQKGLVIFLDLIQSFLLDLDRLFLLHGTVDNGPLSTIREF